MTRAEETVVGEHPGETVVGEHRGGAERLDEHLASADLADHLTSTDEAHLRRALELARRSREHGNHPFGSLVADLAGSILAEAENTVVTEGDVLGHAEANAARLAAARYPRTTLASCTLYTTAEPCAMCAGAIYWANIGRVVYALSELELLAMTGSDPKNPTLSLPCRDVFARGQRPVAVVGPVPWPEAVAVHEGFWSHREASRGGTG